MIKVIVANDLVGLGKVALTSSLPIMSACQTEVLPLPTVLLSSHTGEFENIYVRDLTDDLKGFCEQWEHLDVMDRVLSSTLSDGRPLKYGLCYEPHIGYLFSGFNALLEEKNEK